MVTRVRFSSHSHSLILRSESRKFTVIVSLQSFLRIIDEMAAIITITVQLYLQIYWVSAKTGFDKRRRWSQSFPLPNFSVKVLVVEAGDFRHIFPDSTKYTGFGT